MFVGEPDPIVKGPGIWDGSLPGLLTSQAPRVAEAMGPGCGMADDSCLISTQQMQSQQQVEEEWLFLLTGRHSEEGLLHSGQGLGGSQCACLCTNNPSLDLRLTPTLAAQSRGRGCILVKYPKSEKPCAAPFLNPL